MDDCICGEGVVLVTVLEEEEGERNIFCLGDKGGESIFFFFD